MGRCLTNGLPRPSLQDRGGCEAGVVDVCRSGRFVIGRHSESIEVAFSESVDPRRRCSQKLHYICICADVE